MNCDKCQELLSDFFDDALGGEEHALLGAHLEECLNCADARREFQSILSVARASREDSSRRPTSTRWARIA